MDATDAADQAKAVGAKAEQHAASLERSGTMRALARVGHAANGVVHLAIAGIAISVAAGVGVGSADQSGAMRAIAALPLGVVALWGVAAALIGLAVFSVIEAVAARRAEGWSEVAKGAGKAVAYASVAATSMTYALGGSSDGNQAPQSLSGQLMQHPAGALLVGAIGVGIAAIGVVFVVRGATGSFLEHVAPPPSMRSVAKGLGTAGYIAKGLAVGIVGVLFVVAAFTNDPGEAAGLDGALRTLQELPFGPLLLGVVGVGIAAYGVFCIVRAGWATKR